MRASTSGRCKRDPRAAQPRYPLDSLKAAVHAATDEELARRTRLNKTDIRNLRQRGVTWTRADELAIACGFMPWEVWAEWADANPADWCRLPDDIPWPSDAMSNVVHLSVETGIEVEVAA